VAGCLFINATKALFQRKKQGGWEMMKKLFALFAVAVMAMTVSMVGCNKGPKVDSAVLDTAKGFCDKEKQKDMWADFFEFSLRATYDKDKAGGKSLDDVIKLGRETGKNVTVEFKDCEAKDPKVMKCDEIYEKMSGSLGISLDKTKEAGKQMAISDCAAATMQQTQDGKKAVTDIYFGKAKDKWVMIGSNEKNLGDSLKDFWNGINKAPAISTPGAQDAPAGTEAGEGTEKTTDEGTEGTKTAPGGDEAEPGAKDEAPATEGETGATPGGEETPQGEETQPEK
jgi:hypothetical protein